MESDAALLRLQNPSHATPMQLISNDSLDAASSGSTARVIGWGTTSEGGDVSEDLREVDMPIVDDETCGEPQSYGDEFVPAVMLCVGLPGGGVDSCQGDSGGPLMVNTGGGVTTGEEASAEGWKLAGIVSWGEGCAEPDKYGIYTRLANHGIRAWIYQTIDSLPVGLQNPSFEQPLGSASDWTATVYDESGDVVRSGANACPSGLSTIEAQRRICRVGTDSFEVTDVDGPREITVSPIDGSSMLRLGGPFREADEDQLEDRYVASQSFVVDPASPVVHLNYDMFTFDYTNFDELRLRVRLFDADGDVVFNKVVGSFGPGGDISFKSTGWRSANVDLSSLAGEEVTLRIDSGGTQDELFGFWAYIDAGTVPEVVSHPGEPEVPALTPASGGNQPKPVLWQIQEDANGLTYYNFAASSANAFAAAGQCLPMKIPVPINPGAGTVSNVSLLLDQTAGGSQQVPLEDPDGNNLWTVAAGSSGLCVQMGTLYVVFTLTEGGVSQDFVVPLGGITLIDPEGTVYDGERYEADVGAGMSPEAALVDSALGGAAVTLERKVGGGFQVVLSGDPGIAPNVNPEITPANGPSKGLFQWDVAVGEYRVHASLAGYLDAVTTAFSVPPEVTGLNIALRRHPLAAVLTPQLPGQTSPILAATPAPSAARPSRAGRGRRCAAAYSSGGARPLCAGARS